MQQIQVLAFVLVQTFDLNIENRLWIDLNTGTNFHELRQTDFIRLLNLAILLTEFRIISEFFQIDQLIRSLAHSFCSDLSNRAASAGLHCLIQRRGVIPLVTLWNLFGHSW